MEALLLDSIRARRDAAWRQALAPGFALRRRGDLTAPEGSVKLERALLLSQDLDLEASVGEDASGLREPDRRRVRVLEVVTEVDVAEPRQRALGVVLAREV